MRLNRIEREREEVERAERVRAVEEAAHAARQAEQSRVENLHRAITTDPDPVIQADIAKRKRLGREPIQPVGLKVQRGVPIARPVLGEDGTHAHLICFGRGFGAKGRNVNLWQLVWSGTGEPLGVGLFASEEDANQWRKSR